MIQDSGFRVQSSGFGVQGSECSESGFGGGCRGAPSDRRRTKYTNLEAELGEWRSKKLWV
jgi:hypothetical protein